MSRLLHEHFDLCSAIRVNLVDDLFAREPEPLLPLRVPRHLFLRQSVESVLLLVLFLPLLSWLLLLLLLLLMLLLLLLLLFLSFLSLQCQLFLLLGGGGSGFSFLSLQGHSSVVLHDTVRSLPFRCSVLLFLFQVPRLPRRRHRDRRPARLMDLNLIDDGLVERRVGSGQVL